MATVSMVLGAVGPVAVSLEYDDVSLRVTALVVDNGSADQNAYVELVRASDGKVYGGRTFGPGRTRVSVPTNQANRVQLVGNARGGFDGYEIRISFPA